MLRKINIIIIKVFIITVIVVCILLAPLLIRNIIPERFSRNFKKTIWYVGGYSGGHIIPLLSLSRDRLDKESKTVYSSFFTSTDLLDLNIMEQHSSCFSSHHSVFLTRLSALPLLFQIPLTIIQSIFVLCFFTAHYWRYLPEEICTTGSFVGLLGVIPAWIYNTLAKIFFSKPITTISMYHLDAIPGGAGKFISLMAQNNFYVFDSLPRYLPYEAQKNSIVQKRKAPLLYEKSDLEYNRKALCNYYGFPHDKKIVLILGGSQGSHEINKLLFSVFKSISLQAVNDLLFIHQAGAESDLVQEQYDKHGIKAHVVDFVPSLKNFYQLADIIIMRGGSMSIAEAQFFNKRTLIVPLRNVANDHQFLNAQEAHKVNPELFVYNVPIEDFLKTI